MSDDMKQPIKMVSSLLLVSLLIGGLSGLLTYVFGTVLLGIGDFRGEHWLVLLPFLGLVGGLIVYLYQRFGKSGHLGMGTVFAAGQGEEEQLPAHLIPLVMGTTWLTHLFGGSAGREGVAVQLGATIGQQVGRLTGQQLAPDVLVVIGMAAGFAGLFQTPLAATFFALEVLVIGRLRWQVLMPSLLAALTASQVSHSLGLEKFVVPMKEVVLTTPALLIKVAVLALVFSFVGQGFARFLGICKTRLATYLPNPYYRVLLWGTGLAVVLLVCHQGRYSGLGTNLIEASLMGGEVYSYDWLLKVVLTCQTLALGYQGGEVTPLFAIGASLGVVLAPLLGLPVALAAALGYVSVFASSTRTVLAPIFIGLEVFGGGFLLPLVVCVGLVFSLSRSNTIYGQQKLAKSLQKESIKA